jgi:hypothetical protein
MHYSAEARLRLEARRTEAAEDRFGMMAWSNVG